MATLPTTAPSVSGEDCSTSPRTDGVFTRFDRYMQTHTTLESHLKVIGRALPSTLWFWIPVAFTVFSLPVTWFPFLLEHFSPQATNIEPALWVSNIYWCCMVAFDAVATVITFVVSLPFRAFFYGLAVYCVGSFILFPYALATAILLPICAYWSFGVFTFLPPVVVRLLDYLTLPALIHYLYHFFSPKTLTPFFIPLCVMYVLLTVTALFDLAPLRLLASSLAKAETARSRPVIRVDLESQAELERLRVEVEELRGIKGLQQ